MSEQTHSSGSPAKHRDTRLIFSKKADDYAAARPDYPAALFEALAAICPPGENHLVADVGAGTGLLTQGLLKTGYRVIAVEPNAEMRQAADAHLGRLNGYRSVDGSAEAMPIESGSVDLIAVAQAFHWFDVQRARAEFLRVLKPAGSVALISNERVKTAPVQQALNQIFEEKRHLTRTSGNLDNAASFFGTGAVGRFSWPHIQRLDEHGLASLVFSRSHIPERDTPEGERVVEQVCDVFTRFAVNDAVELPYQTIAWIGRPV